VLIGRVVTLQKGMQCHHDARRAKPALHCACIQQCLLNARQGAGIGQTFNRRDASIFTVSGKSQTCSGWLTINDHCTGATHTVITTSLGSGQCQLLAQNLKQVG
jgi:hypothetical protein